MLGSVEEDDSGYDYEVTMTFRVENAYDLTEAWTRAERVAEMVEVDGEVVNVQVIDVMGRNTF